MKEAKFADELLSVADNHYAGAVDMFQKYKNSEFYKYDPRGTILNLCELSGEINLKAYLAKNNIEYNKNHNLSEMLDKCKEIDSRFGSLEKDCDLLITYTSIINYTNKLETREESMAKAIKTVEKIIQFEPIAKMRKDLNIPDPISENKISKSKKQKNNPSEDAGQGR
jgi:hypothetical protein